MKSLLRKYLLFIIPIIVLSIITSTSYSSFMVSSKDYKASEMYIGKLLYTLKINDENTSTYTLQPGTNRLKIEISSLNPAPTYFKLVYSQNNDITVKYNIEDHIPSGLLDADETIEIELIVYNKSELAVEIKFNVLSGYKYNGIESIKVSTKENEIGGIDLNNETLISKMLSQEIKNDNEELFAFTADEQNESGLFKTTLLDRNEDFNDDEVGEEVYYYRGVVENNYVVFANFCWRIVRTNESGESIKLRYNGPYMKKDGVISCLQTGDNITLNIEANKSFNISEANETKYVNYVYDDNIFSNAKIILDSWYIDNIESQGDKITSLIIDEPYCNDTSIFEENTTNIIYGASYRLETLKTPQFKCPDSKDKYTISLNKGNGKLSKPIGLLTADELSYAGAVSMQNNSAYFLYTANETWTMTPSKHEIAIPMVYTSSFSLNSKFVGNHFELLNEENKYFELLPVISIYKNVHVLPEGNGTYNNPFIVQ